MSYTRSVGHRKTRTHVVSIRPRDSFAQFRGQDGLQERAAQADTKDLPCGSKQICDCGICQSRLSRASRGVCDVLPVATAKSSLTTLAIMAYRYVSALISQLRNSAKLTIKVVVITLDIPRP